MKQGIGIVCALRQEKREREAKKKADEDPTTLARPQSSA